MTERLHTPLRIAGAATVAFLLGACGGPTEEPSFARDKIDVNAAIAQTDTKGWSNEHAWVFGLGLREGCYPDSLTDEQIQHYLGEVSRRNPQEDVRAGYDAGLAHGNMQRELPDSPVC
jgi:hypothetical protein